MQVITRVSRVRALPGLGMGGFYPEITDGLERADNF